MSVTETLLLPITPDQPCGENLEDTALLASFDAFRLFGQSKPPDAPSEPDETRIPKPASSPEWGEIRDKAADALTKSKDLRLLAHLGTALLRTDGVPAFCETLTIASSWLETYWKETYPRLDEDAVFRQSALNNFADPMAVVDGLRKTPLVRSRQHGTYSLRDMDIAAGQLPGDPGTPLNPTQVNAAFAAMPLVDLTGLDVSVVGALGALKQIDAKMSETAGTDSAANFGPLTAQLTRMHQALRVQLALHPENAGAAIAEGDGAEPSIAGEASLVSGVVKSRQDAVRALDAVSDFFRRTEPSSPIPLFLDRAKRLVSKDFLEVLADIAPDAVAQARKAGGLKQSE